MADKTNRVPDNETGAYYVDRECIDCDLCRELAPDNFERNEDEGYSFVVKQPETEAEQALCEEARESCPVEAIGNDGAEEDAAADDTRETGTDAGA
jgi:ferredoxin